MYVLIESEYEGQTILGYSNNRSVLEDKIKEIIQPYKEKLDYIEKNREQLQRNLDEYISTISGTGSPPSLGIDFPNLYIEEVAEITQPQTFAS